MGAMATYVRAGLPEVATALAALTGEPHPLAIKDPGTGPNATDLTGFRVLSCVVVPVAVQGCGELCPDLCCLCVSRRK
jgi:hypothetical protein